MSLPAKFGVTERFACLVLGQHRSTQRKTLRKPDDEEVLAADITALAIQYGRYGYRRIAAMLGDKVWVVNVKRVERIWRREGLKVPAKQPSWRLWFNDCSGVCSRTGIRHMRQLQDCLGGEELAGTMRAAARADRAEEQAFWTRASGLDQIGERDAENQLKVVDKSDRFKRLARIIVRITFRRFGEDMARDGAENQLVAIRLARATTPTPT